MKIYTIHDAKAGYSMNPITFRSNGEALRSFEQVVKDPKSQFNATPSDFSLIEIATFDPDNGSIEPLDTPVILVNAAEFSDHE
jgi:hypothetical protein